VGHWVQVGEREGQVQAITWRATKVRTKAGQFLIVPNSVIAKEPVLNYSEPIVPTRLEVDVGVSYLTPPNEVKRIVHGAIADASLALKEPAPSVTIHGFGASSVDYKALFWVEDYANDRLARDQVRTNIWYAFRRHNIEMPWPIQVQYEREEAPLRSEADVEMAAARLASIDLFATLDGAARRSLSAVAIHHLFAAGEAIVRQGAPGDSMFVMLDGRARVVLEPSNQPVALIEGGGYFGEMSMLTGDARTATVRAIDDACVLEINAAAFRALAVEQPAVLQHITRVVNTRRSGLDEARHTAASSAPTQAGEGLLERIQHFLGL
jgi:CRP-like cAMP-binding protein